MKKGLVSIVAAAVFFFALLQLGGMDRQLTAGGNSNRRVIDMREGVVSGLERLGYSSSKSVASSMSVASMTSEVKRGGAGSLVLQGCTGITTIKSSFVRAGELINVSRSLEPDKDGGVVFQWTVSADTTPGEYPIVVTDGASSVILSHKVR